MVNNDKILGSRSYLATGINLEFSKENDVTNFIGRRIDTYNRTDAIAISTVIKGFKKDSLLIFAKNVVHSSLRSGNNFEKILYIISNQEEYQMRLIDSDSFDEKKDRYYKNVRISDELIGLLIDCLKNEANDLNDIIILMEKLPEMTDFSGKIEIKKSSNKDTKHPYIK